MSKPEWCPQDVWNAAEEFADVLHSPENYMHRESREVIARAIMAEREAYLAVIRHSGEAIEASSFQMLMENYIQARTDERLKIAVMALTLVATMSDKPTRKVAMGALAQLGETQ